MLRDATASKTGHAMNNESEMHINSWMVFLWDDVVDMPLMAWNCERNWDGNPGALPEGGDTDSSLLTLEGDSRCVGCDFRDQNVPGRGEEFPDLSKEWLSLTGHDGCVFTGGVQANVKVRAKYWVTRELGTILLIIWSCKLGSPSGIGSIPRTKFDFISRDWPHQRLHVFQSQPMWVPIQNPWYAVYSNWGN